MPYLLMLYWFNYYSYYIMSLMTILFQFVQIWSAIFLPIITFTATIFSSWLLYCNCFVVAMAAILKIKCSLNYDVQWMILILIVIMRSQNVSCMKLCFHLYILDIYYYIIIFQPAIIITILYWHSFSLLFYMRCYNHFMLVCVAITPNSEIHIILYRSRNYKTFYLR